MNDFSEELLNLVKSAPFSGSQRSFALHVGIDHALLNRVLSGERAPTPEFVGRLCGILPADEAARLLKAFLDDIVAETKKSKPASLSAEKRRRRANWRTPLSDVAINLQCEPSRKVV